MPQLHIGRGEHPKNRDHDRFIFWDVHDYGHEAAIGWGIRDNDGKWVYRDFVPIELEQLDVLIRGLTRLRDRVKRRGK